MMKAGARCRIFLLSSSPDGSGDADVNRRDGLMGILRLVGAPHSARGSLVLHRSDV